MARQKRRASRRSRTTPARQLGLNLLKGCHGGPGRGQGRKKRKHNYVPHARRPFVEARFPVHVSTKVLAGLPSLRGRRLWAAVRSAFVNGCKKDQFRIVHFSVQGAHIHLICEARNRQHLSRGVQGFKIRVAKAVNRACGRKGTVFADRYHERIIINPTQCRHAIAYVLNNQRHHAYAQSASYPRNRIDPCSSAAYFGGWTLVAPRSWGAKAATDASTDVERPVAPPTTWLLRGGWRRGGGAIPPDFVPGLPKGAPPLPLW